LIRGRPDARARRIHHHADAPGALVEKNAARRGVLCGAGRYNPEDDEGPGREPGPLAFKRRRLT